MKPWVATEPRLREILQDLRSREPVFHRPELGTSRADFERMTEEGFWEVGASGRRYSRNHVLDLRRLQYPDISHRLHGNVPDLA